MPAVAKIKIVSANNQFTSSQLDIFRRVVNVLSEHNLSVSLKLETPLINKWDCNDKFNLKAI